MSKRAVLNMSESQELVAALDFYGRRGDRSCGLCFCSELVELSISSKRKTQKESKETC